MTALATARQMGLPPTLYLPGVGRYARSEWKWDDLLRDYASVPMSQSKRTELDVRLETGYQFYLDSRCGKCGTPFWYGHTEDNRVQFRVDESVCYGCRAVDSENEARRKSKANMDGITLIAVPTGTEYEDGTADPLISPYEAMRSAK